jgi:hypothetical protein
MKKKMYFYYIFSFFITRRDEVVKTITIFYFKLYFKTYENTNWSYKCCSGSGSASDPDPHRIRIQFLFWIRIELKCWIRIRIEVNSNSQLWLKRYLSTRYVTVQFLSVSLYRYYSFYYKIYSIITLFRPTNKKKYCQNIGRRRNLTSCSSIRIRYYCCRAI